MARGPRPSAVRAAASLLVTVAPAIAAAASLSVDGGPVVLGKVSSVPVTIRVAEEPGTEDRPLRLSANVGSFGDPVRVEAGVHRATYFPPATLFPQLALVAVWKETGRDARVDWVVIPLFGSSKVPVRARRGASVTVHTGTESFGPVKADAKGLAVVPIAVPPDVREASVTVVEGEDTARRTLPIESTPYSQVVAAVVPGAMAADGRDFARLHVIYRGGGADTHERIRVQPSVGEVKLEDASPGRCTYRYVAPVGTAAKEATFAISVDGDPRSRASARIALSLPPPAALHVVPPRVALAPGSGARTPLVVQVTSAEGLGLPDLSVSATANGVPLDGPVTYRGDGRYELAFVAPAEAPADGRVALRAQAVDATGRAVTGVATYRLAAAPRPPRERWDPGWALVGARAGFAHALDDLSGPHAGVEAWAPFRVGEASLLAGLTATAAQASREIRDPLTGTSTRARVTFAPVALRLGLEVYSTRRLSAVVGAGGVAAIAQARSDLAAGTSSAVGFGGMGFASLGWALGRGQVFAELSYAAVPVSSEDLRLQAGGISLDAGFRFGVR